jgi:hypothetical protein
LSSSSLFGGGTAFLQAHLPYLSWVQLVCTKTKPTKNPQHRLLHVSSQKSLGSGDFLLVYPCHRCNTLKTHATPSFSKYKHVSLLPYPA